LIKNSHGFTLTEVMVAIIILMIGMLGLLQSVNIAMEVNIKNQMRDEGIYVGEKAMNELKGLGFDNIPVATPASASYAFAPISTPSKIRGSSKKLLVQRSSRVLASDGVGPTTKELAVVIKWKYKDIEYQNRVVSPLSIIR
jgi:type IV pilus assembly protein PilV